MPLSFLSGLFPVEKFPDISYSTGKERNYYAGSTAEYLGFTENSTST